MKKTKVAIVEDDINMRKSLEFALAEYEEFEVKCFKSALEALKKMPEDTSIIVTDINMPGMDGMALAKELAGKYDIIIMTGNASLSHAIESVRLGVRDFLTKPFDVNALVDTLRKVRDSAANTAAKAVKIVEKSDEQNRAKFLGSSKALEELLKLASKAAITDASVMLYGQSGVGKELFAHFIHDNSPRAKAAFVAINMAAIPENLI